MTTQSLPEVFMMFTAISDVKLKECVEESPKKIYGHQSAGDYESSQRMRTLSLQKESEQSWGKNHIFTRAGLAWARLGA